MAFFGTKLISSLLSRLLVSTYKKIGNLWRAAPGNKPAPTATDADHSIVSKEKLCFP